MMNSPVARFAFATLLLAFVLPVRTMADTPRPDIRDRELKTLNGYFPFRSVTDVEDWKQRRDEIRRRILVSQGLWPMPTKSPLKAVVHGRVERDGYVVDRVFFQSIPGYDGTVGNGIVSNETGRNGTVRIGTGHYVTGSLYRPAGHAEAKSMPAILSPHGHWQNGRFYDAGEEKANEQISLGAESNLSAARFPIQARAVQLARMGCIVFVYDMTGEADSVQIGHRPAKSSHLDTDMDWGFMSVQADLRMQNMMGLQTWNSIRAIDFLLELDEVDPNRIGVTGASGGGTQSMIIGAIDDRIDAAMPCVMVSTAMQGGCTCENAPLLRIGQGNVDIAAAIAPRPLGLTAADDWTVELETFGYPELVGLYKMLGHQDRIHAAFHTQFQHNYNEVNRKEMYEFFNRHFRLDIDSPIDERPFTPLAKTEASVWTEQYPAPSGDDVGDTHEIALLRVADRDSQKRIKSLIPTDGNQLQSFRDVVGGAWETIIGRSIEQVDSATFQMTGQSETKNDERRRGVLQHRGEKVPIQIFEPNLKTRDTVLVIQDQGIKGAYDGKKLKPRISDVIDLGMRVVLVDLYRQDTETEQTVSELKLLRLELAEMVSRYGANHPTSRALELQIEKASALQSKQEPISKSSGQRMWYQQEGTQGWQRCSGYTYGYNHCLFAKRVHDVLTTIKYASETYEGRLHLIGQGRIAGPITLAARAQASDYVDQTLVDVHDFEFGQLKRHDDPMFVPGAVKYLGLDGLTALCSPAKLTMVGKRSSIATRTYEASGHGSELKSTESKVSPAAWLSQN